MRVPSVEELLRGDLVEAAKALGAAETRAKAYRDALHYVRRKVDGYDSVFEWCGVDDFKPEAP